jgi:cell division protein FtsQ
MSKVAEDLTVEPIVMDPRIEQRRAEVSRQRSKRRLLIGGAVAGVAVLAVLGWTALHSPIFSARRVTVVGAIRTGVDPVVMAAGLASAPPLIDVNAGQVARQVERLPWVLHATVTKHWPDDVTVTVSERVPAAVVEPPGGGDVLVDAHGRILGPVTEAPVGIMALVVPVVPGRPGSVLGAAARPGLAVVARVPASLRSQIARVDVAADGIVTLSLTNDLGVTLGRPIELPAKFEALRTVLIDVAPRPPAVIDVTVPSAPAVGPPSS